MTAPTPGPERICFDGFEANLLTGELHKAGRKVRLPNQSFSVLAMLLGRAGQLVTRDELRARLWPSGTFVEYDQSLNAAVNRLREALRDSADKPRFIETLPKRGYRFIGVIQREIAPGLPSPAMADSVGPVHSVPTAITPSPPDPASNPAPEAVGPAAVPAGPTGTRRIPFLAAVSSAVLLLAAAIFWPGHHSQPQPPPSARQVIPFTSLPGQEVAPTFSPDGSHIAFAWNGETGDDRLFDLYVKQLGSERLLRLTHHPARGLVPAWSPDGSTIAFVRDADGDAQIFLIPALGGVERRVVQGVALKHLIRISWSPDGKQIAYPAYGRDGSPEIYLVSLDTLQTRPMTPAPQCWDALEPAFSPDGTQLALVCASSWGVYEIYVAGISDGSLRKLTSMMGEPQGLAWMGNGDRIVFANDPGHGGELWEVTLDGRLSQLPYGEDGSAPAVAPKGSNIAYVRGQNITDIWRLDLTAAHPEESATKLIYSTRTQRNPRFADDGTHIAFQSNRSGSTEIWLTDGEGADPLRLTSFNGAFTDTPSWCSDDRRIAFDSSASGIPAIYIEDITERLPRKVATSRANLSRPAWSQDCRWLFASDNRPTLYRFPATGGAGQPFTNRPANKAVALADQVIFGVLEPTGMVLWSKRPGGGPEMPVEGVPQLDYADAWTANSTGIYYTYTDSSVKQPTVNLYDFANRTSRRITTLKTSPVPGGGFGIAVSADGRWLLYSQVDDLQSDIMLAPGP